MTRSAGSRSIRLPAPLAEGPVAVDRPRISVASAQPLAIKIHGQKTSASRSLQAACQNLGARPFGRRPRASGSQEPDAGPEALARWVRRTAHRASAGAKGRAAKASDVAEGEERGRQRSQQREEPHGEADPILGGLGHASHPTSAEHREAFAAAPAAEQAQRARLGHIAAPDRLTALVPPALSAAERAVCRMLRAHFWTHAPNGRVVTN